MKTDHTEDQELGFQITPIVDIVALLIMFFMVTTSTIPKEGQIGLSTPGDGPVSSSSEPEVFLGVLSDGTVTFNEMAIGKGEDQRLESLRLKLRTLVARYGRQIPVCIQPAPSTRHQRVIDLLDACATVGLKNVSFSEAG